MLPWVLPFEGLPDGSLKRAFTHSPLARFAARAATRGRAPQSIDRLPPGPLRRQRQAAPSGSDSPLRVSAPVESQALGSAGVRAMDSPCAARGIAARYDALRTLRQACRSCRDPAEVPSPRPAFCLVRGPFRAAKAKKTACYASHDVHLSGRPEFFGLSRFIPNAARKQHLSGL
jgi:hypothetical protein